MSDFLFVHTPLLVNDSPRLNQESSYDHVHFGCHIGGMIVGRLELFVQSFIRSGVRI